MRLTKKRRGGRNLEPEELNLLPLMSLFVALVPALLYSAVFLPVSAIDLDFPGTGGAAIAGEAPVTVRLARASFHLESVPGREFPSLDRAAQGDRFALATLRSELVEAHRLAPGARGALLICGMDVPYRDV